MASISTIQDRSLLILIIDITPTTWGKRFKDRSISDQRRAVQKKQSIGPATLSDTLKATTSFLLAFASCHRDNAIVVIGVAGSQVGVLYPRKDVMEVMIHGSMEDEGGCRVDANELRQGFLLGVGELISRCSMKTQEVKNELKKNMNVNVNGFTEVNTNTNTNTNTTADANANGNNDTSSKTRRNGTAIAAATSLALCIINRFMIASGADTNDQQKMDSLLHRKEDSGILSMISSGAGASGGNSNSSGANGTLSSTEQRMAQRRARGMLSPRIMIIQSSEDNTMDYNAFMNCVFCANKNDVVIDGCFVASGANGEPDTSTFLEQACDRTGGVYSTPKRRSQISGGLTSVFMTLYLPTLAVRQGLNMPKVTKVDFRARCFKTGVSLDVGIVCNLCLSIFKEEPEDGFCYTCGAKIVVPGAIVSSAGLKKTNGNAGMSIMMDQNDDSPSSKRTKF